MEFRVADCVYRQIPTSKINGKTQIKIIQKLSPLLASGFVELAPMIVQMSQQGIGNLAELTLTELARIATPVARELAAMSDDDRDFIIAACLSTVERKKDGEVGWARIWSIEAGRAMFSDINDDFTVMLRIALGVFQETFSGFLPTSLSNSTGRSRVDLRSIQ